MLRLTLAPISIAACLATVGWAGAAPPDVATSELFTPAGKLTALHTGVTYQATSFPIPIRVTPPEAGWGGAQWNANQFGTKEDIRRQHLTCGSNPKVCAGPYYGWVTIGKPPGGPNAPPRLLLVLLTSYSPTPSVATTVTRLCRARLTVCEQPSSVKLAGFTGVQVDGETKGAGVHFLIPFTPPSHKAAGDGAADRIELEGAHPFRATVINVRGQTVFVLAGSLVLSPDQFAASLPDAERLLGSLRFPR
jgi:hypothetical protein